MGILANYRARIVRVYSFIYKRKIAILYFCAMSLVAMTGFLTFGKMQLGDNSVELANGLMINAGFVPYADIFIHVTPFTSYLAAFFIKFGHPIHLLNVVGTINLLCATLIVMLIQRAIKLSPREQIFGYLVFFGLEVITLTGFNHHSFDLTFSGAVVYGIIMILKTADDKRKSLRYSIFTAICAIVNFFTTQVIGTAIALLPLLVLLVDFWVNKKPASFQLFKRIALYEAVVSIGVVLILSLGANISPSKMFHSIFLKSYQEYGGAYGYGTIWRVTASNIENALSKYVLHASVPVPQITPSDRILTLADFLPFGTIETDSLFLKIFLNKSSVLYSVITLIALLFILLIAFRYLYIFCKTLIQKQSIDPLIIVSGGLVGIFLLASISVLQINYSIFYLIFIVSLRPLREIAGRYLRIGVHTLQLTLGIFGFLLCISNMTILLYEFRTKEYYVSRVKDEQVWTSSLYYRDFADQFNEMATVIDNEPDVQHISAYPRASEIYYLLNKTPLPPTSLVSFFHPEGDYTRALEVASKSELIVIFEPTFFSTSDEHLFALQVLEPIINEKFSLLFQNRYFRVYKHR